MPHNHPPAAKETPWHIGLMITVLVLGACARFYGIDDHGLSASELSALSMCSSSNWLDMLVRYNELTGMTPLYPVLLCEITDWTSSAELFVRLLSGLAGIGIIYVIYLTGRDFFTPTTGVIAAAVVALDYQTLLASRDASVYSLLALFALLHHYYFCQLFFSKYSFRNKSLGVKQDTRTSQLLWHWQPAFPGDARYLIGFWLTGALAFYTSPMAVLQLLAELLASVYLLGKANPSLALLPAIRSLWSPILIAILPWLAILDNYIGWALKGNLFGFAGVSPLLQQAGNLLPDDPALRMALVVMALLFIMLAIAPGFLRSTISLPRGLVVYTVALALVSLLALALIEPASYLSFIPVWCLLLLLLAMPLADILCRVRHTALQPLVISLLLFVIMAVLAKSNTKYFLYKRGTDADFRLAVSIVQADEGFMDGRRKVYVSSTLFNHYLKRMGVVRESEQLVDIHQPAPDFHEAAVNTYFYYLEYRPNKQAHSETAASRQLLSTYQLHCESRLGKIRVMKFARDHSPVTSETGDCRSYLPHMSTL